METKLAHQKDPHWIDSDVKGSKCSLKREYVSEGKKLQKELHS